MPKPTGKPDFAQLARVWAISLDFVITVAAMALFGWLADRWLGTEPWLLLVGVLLGLAVGFTRFIKDSLAANAKWQRKKPGDRE
jgi:F0F1-type ATP synthase assembly protein I